MLEEDRTVRMDHGGHLACVVCLMAIRRSQCVHAVLFDREIVKDRDRPMKPRPMKLDEIATKIGCSWCLHVSSGKLSIKSTYFFFLNTCVDG